MRPELQAIIDQGLEARSRLAELDNRIEDEIRSLRRKAFDENRELTPEEQDRRRALRAAQSEGRDAFALLAFDRLKLIDQSSELQRLSNELALVNAGLEDDLRELQRIREVAAQAAQVADALVKVVTALAKAAV
ncbi:MAG: hypothetical protein IRY94_06780 [Rhodospirillaceae bacterium]|nr:hypothetical protein [Rhodospirillaceae bacterium]